MSQPKLPTTSSLIATAACSQYDPPRPFYPLTSYFTLVRHPLVYFGHLMRSSISLVIAVIAIARVSGAPLDTIQDHQGSQPLPQKWEVRRVSNGLRSGTRLFGKGVFSYREYFLTSHHCSSGRHGLQHVPRQENRGRRGQEGSRAVGVRVFIHPLELTDVTYSAVSDSKQLTRRLNIKYWKEVGLGISRDSLIAFISGIVFTAVLASLSVGGNPFGRTW